MKVARSVSAMARLASFVAVVAIAACSTESGSPGEDCAEARDCAAGEQCVDGTCEAAGGGDAERPDAVFLDALQRDVVDTQGDTTAADTTSDATTGDDVDPAADADATADGDAAPSDAEPPEDVGPNLVTAEITAPSSGATYELGYVFNAVGVVSDPGFAAEELTVSWRSTLDGELWSGPAEADGTTTYRVRGLSEGRHRLELIATNPLGQSANDLIDIGICSWGVPEAFDADIESSNWQIYGDAYWDEGGWLEMTGLGTGKRGAIFNTGDPVSPGDVQIRFRIFTGGGAGSGADGFAMSIFEASSVAELETWIGDFSSGGCLGYGITGQCGSYEDIEAFHLEFDTWYNTPGDNSGVQDPTEQNHIAVTLNGNPAEHVLWAEVPTLEDEAWHEVEVQIDGSRVTVRLDGETIISDPVPGFRFKGGFIGFTGTTGLYTNWHRFDDLQILEECSVD
jgi:hypothetical protein